MKMTTQTGSSTNSIDLNEYLNYLATRNRKKRSPKTIQLYTRSISQCKLETIDPTKIGEVWSYLRQCLTDGVGNIYVSKTKSIVRGAMRFNAIPFENTKDYQLLINECEQEGEFVEEYTDKDIGLILGLTYESDGNLFRACALQTLSGLRVGALKGLKFEDFHKVEGVDGVRLFRVFSKGNSYVAAISESAYQFLLKDANNSPLVVWHDDGFKTDFSILIWTRLYYLLKKKYHLDSELALDKKSLCHSMRHYAITQMASVLAPYDVALLAGHSVANTTSQKRYVNKKSEGLPLLNYQQKIANLYKLTPLYNYSFAGIESAGKNFRRGN